MSPITVCVCLHFTAALNTKTQVGIFCILQDLFYQSLTDKLNLLYDVAKAGTWKCQSNCMLISIQINLMDWPYITAYRSKVIPDSGLIWNATVIDQHYGLQLHFFNQKCHPYEHLTGFPWVWAKLLEIFRKHN